MYLDYFGNKIFSEETEFYASVDIYLPLAPLPQVSMQPARTNLLTYSWDLTNAAWTETGTSVAVLDAVGMDGVANSACTLTDNDGAAYEKVRQAKSVSTAVQTNTVRVFILKDQDETRFPELELTQTGGSTEYVYLQVNTKTGTTAIRASGGTVDVEANSVGVWWEVMLSLENLNANSTATLHVTPARATTLGSSATSATGSIVVGNVEFYENKTIEQIRGTAPIFTEAAAVSVDNDLIEVAGADSFMSDELVMIFAFTPNHAWAGAPTETFVSGAVTETTRLAYRAAARDGVRANPPLTERLSGNTAGEEVIVSLVSSANLNTTCIGYAQGVAGFDWDSSPTTHQAKTYADVLQICRVLAGGVSVRSLLIYDGLPTDSETLADVQAWVEANAESEILKRQS